MVRLLSKNLISRSLKAPLEDITRYLIEQGANPLAR